MIILLINTTSTFFNGKIYKLYIQLNGKQQILKGLSRVTEKVKS